MEHDPEERLHVAGEGKETAPVPPDCENVTIPVDEPATVAVHVAVAPMLIEEGAQETDIGEVRNGMYVAPVIALGPVALPQ